MRIGIDVRAVQAGSGTRGIGVFIRNLLNGLRAHERETDLIIFTADLPVPPVFDPVFAGLEKVVVPGGLSEPVRLDWRALPLLYKGRTEVILRSKELHLDRQRHELAKAVRQVKIDVFHAPSVFEHALDTGASVGCPSIATFHDAIPIVYKDNPIYFGPANPGLARFYHRAVENLRKFDRIVSVSQHSRDDAVRLLGIRPDRIEVVPCPVNPEYPIPNDFAPPEKPFFLFCSALDPHKNVERLIEAFQQVRDKGNDVKLICVAPAEGAQADHLLRHAFDLGIDHQHLVFTGYIEDAEYHRLLRQAIAVVVPSLYEGFGLPAAQALRMGTPVVASKATSLPEVGGDAAIYVDPMNPTSIAEGMLTVLEDPEKRAEWAEKGIKQAGKFNPERVAAEYIRIYKSVSVLEK